MSKSAAFETAFLQSLFLGTALGSIGTSPIIVLGASLYLTVCKADPGEPGTAITNETTATGYARVAMPRDAFTWSVTGNEATSVIDAVFPVFRSADGNASHWGLVNTASGAGLLLYKGTIKESGVATTRPIANGVQLIYKAGDVRIQED